MNRIHYFESPKQKKKKSAREKAMEFAKKIEKPKTINKEDIYRRKGDDEDIDRFAPKALDLRIENEKIKHFYSKFV